MGLFSNSGVPRADYDVLKEDNEALENENAALLMRLGELEKELNLRTEQKNQCETSNLMEMQNQHLRENLVDIQGNMAESVNASKNSLEKTDSLVENIAHISDKTCTVVNTLRTLDELAEGSVGTNWGSSFDDEQLKQFNLTKKILED